MHAPASPIRTARPTLALGGGGGSIRLRSEHSLALLAPVETPLVRRTDGGVGRAPSVPRGGALARCEARDSPSRAQELGEATTPATATTGRSARSALRVSARNLARSEAPSLDPTMEASRRRLEFLRKRHEWYSRQAAKVAAKVRDDDDGGQDLIDRAQAALVRGGCAGGGLPGSRAWRRTGRLAPRRSVFDSHRTAARRLRP